MLVLVGSTSAFAAEARAISGLDPPSRAISARRHGRSGGVLTKDACLASAAGRRRVFPYHTVLASTHRSGEIDVYPLLPDRAFLTRLRAVRVLVRWAFLAHGSIHSLRDWNRVAICPIAPKVEGVGPF